MIHFPTRKYSKIKKYVIQKLYELNNAAERSAEYSERHFRLYGLIAFLSPLTTGIDYLTTTPYWNTLGIRALAIPICLPALLYRHLGLYSRKYFHIYFVLATAFVFPFSFALMLIMNAAYAPAGHHIDMLWMLQYFIVLFVFFQVLYSGFLATTLWTLATVAAVSSLLFVEDPNYAELHRVIVYPLAAYLSAVALGILSNRQSDILDTERLRAASAIGANLAHELRTPLASIRNLSGGANSLLPILVDAYDKAKAAGIELKPLRQNQLSALRRVLLSINNEVMYSNTIIDMLLVNTAGKPVGEPDLEPLSVQTCINEAVERYPFNNDRERSLIEVNVNEDFTIHGPHLLIVHVLFNLIKNALQYVQRSENARVEITAVADVKSKKIIIYDNGPGIPLHDLPHIFERFFTTNKSGQGAGIGLSFCKTVMESIGGAISCETEERAFTKFTLTFPDHPEQIASRQAGVQALRNLSRRSAT